METLTTISRSLTFGPERAGVNLPKETRYYPALDGLRGVAILAVMTYHFSGGYSGTSPLLRKWATIANAGWMGVDLFFVLSGFLITGILYDTATYANRLKNFYARRALRIFPLFYGLLFGLLVVTPIVHLRWQWGDILYFFYLGNMTALLSPGLANLHPSLNLGHLWSLAVEEQFYLIWPFVVWWIQDRRRLLTIAAAVIAISPLIRLLLLRMHLNPIIVGYLLLTRADSLLMGGAVALLSRGPSGKRLPAIPVFFVSLIFLFCILIASGGAVEGIWMSSIGYTLIAICASCLVYAAQFSSTKLSHVAACRFLRFFGRYSYGLYIFHGLIFLFARREAGRMQSTVHHAAWAQMICVSIGFGVSLVLSMLSYHFFEAPVMTLKRFFHNPPLTLPPKNVSHSERL